MPTPEEPTLPPSPPTERAERSTFASCPPEEDREAHAPREASEEDEDQTVTGTQPEVAEDHAIAQEPTPEPEIIPQASEPESRARDKVARDVIDAPSPVASPDATESDAPQARLRGQGDAHLEPEYLSYPQPSGRVRMTLGARTMKWSC